jgi:hypothetical protein
MKPVLVPKLFQPCHRNKMHDAVGIRILYGLAEDGLTNKKGIPKSIQHKAIVACMSDMNLPGFFTLIFPVLKCIAKKAKVSGAEQRLIDIYCI